MDPSELLGQKLLQGWTMLGDTCQKCCAPLMRSRDGTQTVCAVCEGRSASSASTKKQTLAASTVSEILPVAQHSADNINVKALVECILDRLNASLKDTTHIPMICDLFESGLKPLRIITDSMDRSALNGFLPHVEQLETKLAQTLNQLALTTGQGIQENMFYFDQVSRILEIYKIITEFELMK